MSYLFAFSYSSWHSQGKNTEAVCCSPLQWTMFYQKIWKTQQWPQDWKRSIFISIPKKGICWIIEKARGFHKNIYFCFIDYSKAFDCMDHNILWKILKEIGIPDHLICLLRNLYAGQIRSVAQSCPTLCDPMNCSTPGLPVHHQLPEFTQTHVHRVSDAI